MFYNENYSYWRPRPTSNDFELEVISKHPDFNNRPLKKYSLDGISTVGVWGEEPFEIHLHNRSSEDAQARISLDGTDVLTGKPASLEVTREMWIIRAGTTLHLRAWAENNQGGARFVFTSGDKSVALHAHGDVSHKGIISAAIFTEKDRPVRPYYRNDRFMSGGMQANSMRRHAVGAAAGDVTKGGSFGDVVPCAAPAGALGEESLGGAASASLTNNTSEQGMSFDMDLRKEKSLESKSMKKEAAVGAGEYVEQRTKTVKGLDNPVLNAIVRVRYMWWDDLNAKLGDAHASDPHPTGFPAEKIKTFADLSGVPRVTSVANSAEGVYARTKGNTRTAKGTGCYHNSHRAEDCTWKPQTFDRVVL